MEHTYNSSLIYKCDSAYEGKLIRILRIIVDLQQGKKVKLKDIARECNVSERTAYRYMSIVACIMPVEVEYGRNGGYYIRELYEKRHKNENRNKGKKEIKK